MVAIVVAVLVGLAAANCTHLKSIEKPWIPDFIGEKPVLLDFFFNACEACNENEEDLEKLLNLLSDKITFKAIEIDCDEGEHQKWVAKYHPEYEIIQSCDQRLETLLGISTYPTLVVLTPEGGLLLSVQGELSLLSLSEWELHPQMEKILNVLKMTYPEQFSNL